MSKKEFIRIVRELQKLQIELLKSSNMSISMSLNNSSVDSSNYSISLFLFTSDEKNIVKDVKSCFIYSSDSITKANSTLREIMKRIETTNTPLRGNKRSEAERSDAPIK